MKFLKKKKWLIASAFFTLTGGFSLYILARLPEWVGPVKLYYYTIISNIYISVLPHEPVLLYYGKLYNVLVVSLVAGVAATFAGFIDFETLTPLLHHRKVRKLYVEKSLYKKSVYYFSKFPFWTIVIAAFTPIPFYPFKLLSIASSYPESRYLIALFLGRVPRYFYLVSVGNLLDIPNWVLIVLFVGMFLVGVIQRILGKRSERLLKEEQPEKELTETKTSLTL